jgi:DME family drug/metabolite transporter
VLVAAVLFGTTGTARALGPDISPLGVGAARIAVGAALLALVAASMSRRSTPKAPWALKPILLGGAGVAAYQLSFFAAVADTGVAVGTVVAIGSAPVFAGLLSRITAGAHLDARWAGCTALATAGVGILVASGGGGAAAISAPGVALALGAGLGYAVYTVAAKRLLEDGHEPEAVMARTFGAGALMLLPVLPATGFAAFSSPSAALVSVYLGAIPTALAYILFARGLRHLPTAEVATLTLAEPVTAAALGMVVLGEQLSPSAALGATLVIAGLAALAARPRRIPLEARASA